MLAYFGSRFNRCPNVAQQPGNMLNTTFLHIQGIGPQTERKLHEAGITTWADALMADSLPLSVDLAVQVRKQLQESVSRLQDGDALWFSERLPAAEQWRLFPHFRHSVAYVDIETTGLSCSKGHVTTISLYNGQELSSYVYGENLVDFAEDITAYKLLVTWNGRCFDMPYMRQSLGIPLRMAHLDLLPVFRALNLRGGLKKVEKALGLDREDLDGVNGYMAVMLWRAYEKTSRREALETLLAYNAADVFSLEMLSHYACARNGHDLGYTHRTPVNPYHVDRALVERLMPLCQQR